MDLSKFIRNVEDFPKAGVQFKDVTPLLGNSEAMESCIEQLLALIGDQKIDKVAAIESRGFFFGTLLAQRLNAGFVPIRKPGKLPYKTLKEPYQLEYGLNALEIHEDAIKKGERVLLHDDVLATGGTARAACNLIEQLGGEIVQCNFLLEIEFLNGIQKLRKHSVQSLLKY
ncbi:adenine phosphoribosyltransferase [Aequorivita lipolytica]|uniref:Adenine phosphoribosyltransferase n=1 Tax=Aequorivita lipolytica TaxID=153267 RepID=A0A5C6YPB1_9FLAO|nr:adenine phosphoribosyltransferase [Aequorivita lipolytica]TXD68683.1 adenine phosphoribosyltransferase [Aequorivita lipolytica]SRX53174.1 Adenine phosphoribosyltransferase [Aequorivita lipolytica]